MLAYYLIDMAPTTHHRTNKRSLSCMGRLISPRAQLLAICHLACFCRQPQQCQGHPSHPSPLRDSGDTLEYLFIAHSHSSCTPQSSSSSRRTRKGLDYTNIHGRGLTYSLNRGHSCYLAIGDGRLAQPKTIEILHWPSK